MRRYCGLMDASIIGKSIELFGWMDSLWELGHLRFFRMIYRLYWGFWLGNEEVPGTIQ